MSAASVRIILSARAVWASVKYAEVTEKAQTTSMMARKSRVEMVICYRGDAEVLNPATLHELWYWGPEAFEV